MRTMILNTRSQSTILCSFINAKRKYCSSSALAFRWNIYTTATNWERSVSSDPHHAASAFCGIISFFRMPQRANAIGDGQPLAFLPRLNHPSIHWCHRPNVIDQKSLLPLLASMMIFDVILKVILSIAFWTKLPGTKVNRPDMQWWCPGQ